MPITITSENFDEVVMKSKQPVLLDFWAVWCGPCRMIGPLIEEIGKEYDGRVVVGKVDVDNNPGIASKFGIRNIPTVLYLKGGQILDKVVGAVPKQVLVKKLEAIL